MIITKTIEEFYSPLPTDFVEHLRWLLLTISLVSFVFQTEHPFVVNHIQPTIPHKNNETNDKFYRKVAFIMYTEMGYFRPQS